MARKDVKKAYRLNKRLKEGGTLTAEQQAWLDGYNPRVGRPPASEAAEADASGPSAVGDQRPPVAPEFEAASSAEDTMPPAPDTPPVRPRGDKSKAKKGSGDWRSKYRAGAADGERESTCVQAAVAWGKFLVAANASIEKNGGTPMIPSAHILRDGGESVALGPIGQCLVLAADAMIPSDFAVGPEIEAAAVSTIIITHAWWKSRTTKTKESAKDRAAKKWGAAYVNPEVKHEDIRAKPAEAEPAPAPPAGDGHVDEPTAIVKRGGNGRGAVNPIDPKIVF